MVAVQAHGGRQRNVSVRRRVVSRQRVCGVEHLLSVAGSPRVADAGAREPARGFERFKRLHGVGAVDGIGRRVRVERNRHKVTVEAVELRAVRATVGGAAATRPPGECVEPDVEPVARRTLEPGAHQHSIASGVSQVGRDDPVVVCAAGRDHRAGHPGRVGEAPVGHVARLQVAERAAVADDVLQRLDVRGVDVGPVRIRQDAVGDGEPDLRGIAARGADAVFAREIEVARRPRGAWRNRSTCGGRGHGDDSARRDKHADQTSSHSLSPPVGPLAFYQRPTVGVNAGSGDRDAVLRRRLLLGLRRVVVARVVGSPDPLLDPAAGNHEVGTSGEARTRAAVRPPGT